MRHVLLLLAPVIFGVAACHATKPEVVDIGDKNVAIHGIGPPGAVCGDHFCDNGGWPAPWLTDPDFVPECYSCPLDCAVNAAPGTAVAWKTGTAPWGGRGCEPITCGDHYCNGDECNPASPRYCPGDCAAADWTYVPTTGFCYWNHGTNGDNWCQSSPDGHECQGWVGKVPPDPDGPSAPSPDCPACGGTGLPQPGHPCYARESVGGAWKCVIHT